MVLPHRRRREPAERIASALFRLLLPEESALGPEDLRSLERGAAKEISRNADAWSLTVRPSELVWSTHAYSLAALQEQAHSVAERLEPLLGAAAFAQALLRFLVSLSVEESKIERLLPFLGNAPWREIDQSQWTLNGSFPRGRYAVQSLVQPASGSYISSIEVVADSVAPQDLTSVVADLDQQGLRFIPNDLEIQPAVAGSLSPLQAIPFLMEGQATADRAELLLRKHSGQPFSDDDEKRLEALSTRVRQLLPRVTRKDWDKLARIGARTDETEAIVDEVRRKYRLGSRG
jgi:hypothetical protein